MSLSVQPPTPECAHLYGAVMASYEVFGFVCLVFFLVWGFGGLFVCFLLFCFKINSFV